MQYEVERIKTRRGRDCNRLLKADPVTGLRRKGLDNKQALDCVGMLPVMHGLSLSSTYNDTGGPRITLVPPNPSPESSSSHVDPLNARYRSIPLLS